jgi:hypothetical protein
VTGNRRHYRYINMCWLIFPEIIRLFYDIYSKITLYKFYEVLEKVLLIIYSFLIND